MKRLTVVLLLTGILTLLSACGAKSFDMTPYVSVELNGFEGEGTVEVDVNRDELYDALYDALRLDKDEDGTQQRYLKTLVTSITYEVTPNEKLENGDTVELTASYDEAAAEPLNITLDGDTTYEIDGLGTYETLTEEEAFEGISVTFEGVSPFLEPKLKQQDRKTSEAILHLTFEIEEDYVGMGDEVTVVAEETGDLQSVGYVPLKKPLKKTFPVEGSYASLVTDWSELDEESQTLLFKEGHDFAMADFYAKFPNWIGRGSDNVSARAKESTKTEPRLESAYLLTWKEKGVGEDGSILALFYEIDWTVGEAKEELAHKTHRVYYGLTFMPILLDEKGKLRMGAIQKEGFKPNFDRGYLFEKIVTARQADWHVQEIDLDGGEAKADEAEGEEEAQAEEQQEEQPKDE